MRDDSPSTTRAAAGQLAEQLKAWRRHFHAHPELSGQEEQTAAFIAEELRKLGCEPRERIGGTCGLSVDLVVPGRPFVALRADMDGLPITELTGAAYASQNAGVMHACGHDAHMAMLLGVARMLAERKADLRQSVRLIFQPAEEGGGGAELLVAGGVLADVQRIFGLHVWSEMPLGTLGTRVGPFMSSTNPLRITVRGRGGHAAMPHQCVDPVVVAAQLVVALQTVVSRNIAMTDSAVVSVTRVQAGSATNIIPETAELAGTVRTLNMATRATIVRRIGELAQGIAGAYGATAEATVEEGYPVLVNDAGAVERALATARRLGFTEDQLLTLPAQGGGEDFAYYLQQVPGAFLFLGARNEAKGCKYPHHHAHFDIDEAVLPLGVALLTQLALDAETER